MLKKFEVQWKTSSSALLLTARINDIIIGPWYQTDGEFVIFVLQLFVHSHNYEKFGYD